MSERDNLSYLLEHGMPLSDIRKYQADGLSLDEVAAAAESLLEQGKPIADPEKPQEAPKKKSKLHLTGSL